MKKLNPFLTVIFVAAAVAIIGYAYTVFNGRYGGEKKGDNVNDNQGSIIENLSDYLDGQSNENVNENQNENQNANENGNQNDNTNANVNTNAPGREDIVSKDCDNNCSRFKGNEENYKYCQQICGDISPSKKESEQDCADLTGLEKDYCFRDLAVSKLNSSICAKIGDKKLQSACRNRVAEELLD